MYRPHKTTEHAQNRVTDSRDSAQQTANHVVGELPKPAHHVAEDPYNSLDELVYGHTSLFSFVLGISV